MSRDITGLALQSLTRKKERPVADEHAVAEEERKYLDKDFYVEAALSNFHSRRDYDPNMKGH